MTYVFDTARPLTGRDASRAEVTATGGDTPRTLGERFADVINPLEKGAAVNDPAEDSAAAIQAAIDEAAERSSNTGAPVLVDLLGMSYGVGSPLELTERPGVRLGNGKLFSLGSGWTSDDFVVQIGDGGTSLDTANVGVTDLVIDCGHEANGLGVASSYQSFAQRLQVIHQRDYGIRHWGTGHNPEFVFSSCDARQYAYGETGFDDVANRTAIGISIEDADALLDNCTGAYCLKPLQYLGELALFNNCHFYNGTTLSGTDNIAIYVGPGASAGKFVGCYSDNGLWQFEDSFAHQLIACQFQKTAAGNNNAAIDLVTSTASATASGLAVLGAEFQGTWSGGFVRKSTTGAGSWGTLGVQWGFNQKADGTLATIESDGAGLYSPSALALFTALRLKSTFPFVDLQNTGSGSDQKIVRFLNSADLFRIILRNDANSSGSDFLSLARAGTTPGLATWGGTHSLAFQSFTAAQIASAASLANTASGKKAGMTVLDTTNSRLMVALGTSAVSGWAVADGSATVTPS